MSDIEIVAAAVDGTSEIKGGDLVVERGAVVSAMRAIKRLGGMMLFDITCVDRPEGFEVAWRFMDLRKGAREAVTVRTVADHANPEVPSVVEVYKSADVLEREVWDLMGIKFTGREGLTRILCADDFEGHPLRKDFVLPRRPRHPGQEVAR